MERAFEGDDAEALGVTVHKVIAARRLDRAFQRFRTGIGKEDTVGETVFDEALRKPLLARDVVEVRDMPELARLLGQRRYEMRMAMPERIDRDAACEIEIAIAVRGVEPAALASLESERRAGEGLEKGSTVHHHHPRHCGPASGRDLVFAEFTPQIKKAARGAACWRNIGFFARIVNAGNGRRAIARPSAKAG